MPIWNGSGLLASGARKGAVSLAQEFTNGLKAPSVTVLANGTTAFRIFKADGTTAVVTVDTTTGILTITATPVTGGLRIQGSSGAADTVLLAPGTASSFDRLDFIAQTTNRSIAFQVVPNGTATAAKVALANASDAANFGSLYFGVAGDTARIATQSIGSPSAPATKLILNGAGALGGTSWSEIGLISQVFIGTTELSPTALLHVGTSTTSRAAMRLHPTGVADPTTPLNGDVWFNTGFIFFGEDATTNAVVPTLRLRRSSSGTPAAGFGSSIAMPLKSSTTANQDAGLIETLWNVATHASRAADVVFSAFYTSTKREFLRGRGGASDAQIGFLGATPASRQTVTGSRGSNAALASLITALANLGLVTDSSS